MPRTPPARPRPSHTSRRTSSVRPPMRSRRHVLLPRKKSARSQGDSSAGGSRTSSRTRFASSYSTTSGCGTTSAGRYSTAEMGSAGAWLARGRELLNVRFRDHLVALDGGDLHDARGPRSKLCRVILGRMKSGFALEERHAESLASRGIDEPVPALEPLEPLRRGSDRLLNQLGPGFELAWRSLVPRDTSEHLVPPPFRSITEASLRAGRTRQAHAPAQT